MDSYNRFENTFIACRTTNDFKDRMENYARQRDLNISQVVRRGVKLLMESEPTVAPAQSGWSIQ